MWSSRIFVVVLSIAGFLSTLQGTYRITFTQRPLLGHRCALNNMTDMPVLGNLTNNAYAQCVWRCLSNKNCVGISHNIVYNYCELSAQLCEYLEPNEEFIVNFYGVHFYDEDHKYCLQWKSLDQYDPRKAVAFPLSPSSPQSIIAVARILHATGLYPGKYKRYQKFDIRAVLESGKHAVAKVGEVLLLGPGCRSIWVAYLALSALPVGAVVGGHIGEELLYVARTIRGNDYGIGYFRKSTQRGYFRMKSNVKTKTIELLVLL